MDHVPVVSLERALEIWDEFQTYEYFLERKAEMNPEILSLIEGLRPAIPSWGQDVIDILTWAGITVPE